MDSDDDGIAYFHFEYVSFLLQDYLRKNDVKKMGTHLSTHL